MYKLVFTPTFEKFFKKLDKHTAKLVTEKIDEFSQYPVGFSKIHNIPKSLQGLLKYRIGDYRVIFWLDDKNETIILYLIAHRKEIYKILEKL